MISAADRTSALRPALFPALALVAVTLPLFLGLARPAAAQVPAVVLQKVDPWVLHNTEGGRRAEFLVVLAEQADLGPASGLQTKAEKGQFVYETLWRHAQETQPPLRRLLEERGLPHRSYYIVNLFWVEGDRRAVVELASRPDVGHIEGNPLMPGLVDHSLSPLAPEPAGPFIGVEPNIAYTNADQVWALGFTGQGVVIGGQDTGYQWDHPALISKYRGWNGTTANHDYNWHDSIHSGGGSCGANSPVPCDDNAHGTHTMGTACGDDGLGNQIGMAPGAQWIGSRNMDQGNGTPATYIESFEFFLAPYPVGGTTAQGNPLLAPDVTTNSWLCPPSEGCSASSLLAACQAQRAAGIFAAFAAGNSGSSCSTVQWPPAIYDEVYSVGAHSYVSGSLANFSSRGPVTVDGSNRMKPDVAAPGVGVRSSVPGSSYASGWSGTSMATPHVAGAVALMWSAHPGLKGQVDLTEQILNDQATHVSSSSCSSTGWPNNLYGHGRLDVLAAVSAVHTLTLAPASVTQSGAAGTTVNFNLTLTNTGYLADSYLLSAGSSPFNTTVSPTTINSLASGASQLVTVSVQVPLGAVAGQSSTVAVTASSQNWAGATASAMLDTVAVVGPPTLSLVQPGGPGSGAQVLDGNLITGHEYYNIFSVDLCPGGVGTGPYLGLCTNDINFLLTQFLAPVGAVPFHFLASDPSASFGPYSLPPGSVIDGVCFDFTGGQFLSWSAVAQITVQ